MRSLVLFLLFSGILYPQTHGTHSAWSSAEVVPLSQTGASAGGGVPNTLIALGEGKILVFYTEQFPFPGGPVKPFFAGSTDNGQTWSAPSATLIPPVAKTTAIAGSLGAAKLASGNVAVSWASANPQGIFSAIYNPATASWGDTVRVSQYVLRSTGYQFTTADRKGRIHIVWSDGRLEPGSVQEVYYSRSTDGGASWSEQKMLSSDDGRHSSFPCGDFTGTYSDTLAFAWRDSTSGPKNWDVNIVVSTDGGVSWQTPKALTSSTLMQSDPQVIVDKHGGFYLIFHEYSTACAGGYCASVYFGYSSDGGASWGSGFRKISPENIRSHLCKSAYDYANDRFWAFWKDERDFNFTTGNPEADIVGRSFESRGSVAPDTLEFISDMGDMEAAFHNFSAGADGYLYAVWYADYSQSAQPRKMYFSRRVAVTGLKAEETVNTIGELEPLAYPNPFNPSTVIAFSLNQPALASVSIYDMTGGKTMEIFSGYLDAGTHSFQFDARSLSAGIYICQVATPVTRKHLKLALVK